MFPRAWEGEAGLRSSRSKRKNACFVHTAITQCHFPVFLPGDRTILLNDTEHQVDFKSHQWFGATVRSHGDTILVRRPSQRWFWGLGQRRTRVSVLRHNTGALPCCNLWVPVKPAQDSWLWETFYFEWCLTLTSGGMCMFSVRNLSPRLLSIKLLSFRSNFHLQSQDTVNVLWPPCDIKV